MAFYTIIERNKKIEDLETELNDALVPYQEVIALPGFAIGYGNDKNHGCLVLDAGSTGGTEAELSVKLWSNNKLTDLVTDMTGWLEGDDSEDVEILGLSFYYDKPNDKFKVMVPYRSAATSTSYSVGYEKDNDDIDTVEDLDNELAGASEVVGYGYTYAQKSNMALYIYVEQ